MEQQGRNAELDALVKRDNDLERKINYLSHQNKTLNKKMEDWIVKTRLILAVAIFLFIIEIFHLLSFIAGS